MTRQCLLVNCIALLMAIICQLTKQLYLAVYIIDLHQHFIFSVLLNHMNLLRRSIFFSEIIESPTKQILPDQIPMKSNIVDATLMTNRYIIHTTL